MNTKKILGSIITLGIVGAVVIGASNAFFSDTETSTGNVLAAGAIDLLIDNDSYVVDYLTDAEAPSGLIVPSPNTSWQLADLTIQKFFDFEDLKPGDFGEDTISIHVDDNDAWVCAAANLAEDNENDITEPEADLEDDAETGELDEVVNFVFWEDDGDNVYEEGEDIFLQGPISAMGQQGQIALADSNTNVWEEGAADTPVVGAQTYYVGKYWCMGNITLDAQPEGNENPAERQETGFNCDGTDVNNESQTDSVVVDLEFYAEQARNNDEFSCNSWTPSFEGDLPEVGATLSSYVGPENCDATVADTGGTHQTIQEAVDDGGNPNTICVEDGTYSESVVIDRPLTLAAENGPLNSATIAGGIRIDSDDVTVTGFIITTGPVPAEPVDVGLFINGSYSNIEISYNNINGTSNVDTTRGILTATGAALANISIMNNEIHGVTTGIYLNPHTGLVDIMYNDFYDVVAGVGDFHAAKVVYNEFDGDDEAIGADDDYDSTDGSMLKYNNFLGTMAVNTYDDPTDFDDTLLAPNNYWETDPETQTGGTDEVDYTPVAASQYPHQ